MANYPKGKNKEIRYDLAEIANCLQKLADAIANSDEIIDGKFRTKRDVRIIFNRAEKSLDLMIEQMTKEDIFRDITKVTAREILRKMRKYMLHLFKTERQRKDGYLVWTKSKGFEQEEHVS